MPELIAQVRGKFGKQTRSLRQKGLLPAVAYGREKNNVSIEVSYKDFEKVFKESGETSVITLKVAHGKKEDEKNVLIHEVESDPLTGKFIHVDFYEVRMDEKTTASVPLVFIGESLAIKTSGGTLIKSMTEIEVEALVKDLPRQIEVDIKPLETFDDFIYIKDLKVPEPVKVLAKPNDIVALVAPPRKEEVVETAAPVEEVKAEEAKEGALTEPEEKQE